MLSLRKRATQIIRNSKNSHRFVYFIDGKIRTFSTHIDDINTQIAALFGALNSCSLGNALSVSAMLTLALSLLPASGFAMDGLTLPTGYTAASGNVHFNQTPGVLNVSSGSNKAIVNYDTFNVGQAARVNFNLPSASASILNRVVGGNMSAIYGTISSNGRVFLVNPAGIFFGNGANVSVNGLVASTLNITDQKFLTGQYEFSRAIGSNPGHIQVDPHANIRILNGGSASFLSSSFTNLGNISANGGAIQVAVGDRITLGDNLIGLTINEPLKDTLNKVALLNAGNLTASDVKLIASTVKHDVLDVIVNNTGRISANKVIDGAGGTIELIADNGIVSNSGKINANGTQGGQITLQGEATQNAGQLLANGTQGQGGTIQVLANQSVGLTDKTVLNTSGKTGGGTILIGGDYRGGNSLVRNALYTYVGKNVVIKADAQNSGNGGKVIVWGSEATGFYGKISALGGVQSGNGGFVETSGKNYLDMQGQVNANARSAQGQAGTWLLDPRDVNINNTDDSVAYNFDVPVNTWTVAPTSLLSTVSQIKVASVNSALNLGTNVTVNTGTYGSQNGDINVNALINKTSGTTSTLSLLAANDIVLNSSGGITASGTAPLNVILKADQDVGALSPSNGLGSVILNGGLATNNGSVTISGVSATLNNNLNAGTGTVSILATGGDITHTAGALNANSFSMTTLAGCINQTGGSLKANGTVTLDATGGNIGFTGGTVAGNSLNATTHDNGDIITFQDADFNSANLKSNNGDISYNDRDGVSLTADAGNANATVVSGAVGSAANNGIYETDLILTGSNRAHTMNLTANNGSITQSGGTIVGDTLLAATTRNLNGITIGNADFNTVNLATNLGDLNYKDTDGVSAQFNLGSSTARIANITSGTGPDLNGAAEPSGIQILGNSQAGLVHLTANLGNISQSGGTLNAGTAILTALNGGISQSGGVLNVNNLSLQATNGNISQSNGSIIANALDMKVSNGSIMESGGSLTASDTLNMTTVNGDISQTGGNNMAGNITWKTTGGAIAQTGGTIAGASLTANTSLAPGQAIVLKNADFTNVTLKTQDAPITYSDSDGANISVNAGLGTATVTTGTGSSADNGVVENGLILAGSNQADTLNLVANHWDITQAVGSTVSGTTLNTVTKSFGRLTSINDADFVNANLKSKDGNITYHDADTIAVNVQAGNGTVTLSSQTPGLLSGNGNSGIGPLTFTGDNTAITFNVTAYKGQINQAANSTIQGQTLFAETKQSGQQILLPDTDFSNATLKTNNGNIVLNDRDGINLNAQSGLGTTSIMSDVSSLHSLNGWSGTGINLVGHNKAFKLNLTANAGDITQDSGSTMSGNTLRVTTTTGQVLLNNANANNYTQLIARSQQGDVSYRDINNISIASANLNTDGNSSKGNLTVQADGAGHIVQNGNLVGINTLNVITDRGDVTLLNAGNDVQNLSALSNQGNVSYFNSHDLNIASINLDQDGNNLRGNLSLQTAGAHNIIQSGNIVGVDTLKLRTDLGNVTLNLDNNINNLDTGSNSGIASFTNTQSFVLSGANMNMNGLAPKGDLSLTAQTGQITQTAAINANELKVTGNADLSNAGNSVDVFSGNIAGGASGANITFNNSTDLNIAATDMGTGSLSIATPGNLNNDNLSGNNRNITSNNSTINGASISLQASGSSGIDIYNDIHASNEIRLIASNATGAINIHAPAVVASNPGSVYLNSDKLTLDGSVNGKLVQLWPWSLNLSMGIAGGAGGYQLSQALINHINTDPVLGLNTLMFGHQNYTGTIQLGTLNLSGHTLTDVVFNAPRVFDATPNSDFTKNLIMATDRDVYFTAGADTVAHWASAPGGVSYGSNSSAFADLDVQISGSGLIHVRLTDFTGTGNAFSLVTGAGNLAFINSTTEEDTSGTLKNLFTALSNRVGTFIYNQSKGSTITLPGGPVQNFPTSFGSSKTVPFILNQSL